MAASSSVPSCGSRLRWRPPNESTWSDLSDRQLGTRLALRSLAFPSRLFDMEMGNYWGYNSVGFFAPESSYATRTRQ